MPVIFNEPLSFLQRLTEYMEHTYLIHQANTSSDSIERMKVEHSVTSCKWLKLLQIQPYFNWIIPAFEFSLYDLCLSSVGSVWLRLQCPLWPPSGSGQVNPLTPCWEKPMNWSGEWDYRAHDHHWLYTKYITWVHQAHIPTVFFFVL